MGKRVFDNSNFGFGPKRVMQQESSLERGKGTQLFFERKKTRQLFFGLLT